SREISFSVTVFSVLACASPMVNRSRFGRSWKSRVPAPYPTFSTFIAGNEPKRAVRILTIAAPVGVTNSTCGPDEYTGASFSNFSVAGAGTGNVPCAHRTVPPPTFNGEQTH